MGWAGIGHKRGGHMRKRDLLVDLVEVIGDCLDQVLVPQVCLRTGSFGTLARLSYSLCEM